MILKKGLVAVAAFAACAPATVFATAGYFTIGYGAKAMGVAGTGAAMPQDSLAAAVNPAGMAFVDDQADLSVRFFVPRRTGELDTTAVGASFNVEDDSRRTLFAFPNFGYTRALNPDLTVGVSIYGNGGMNTTFDRNIYDQSFAALGAFQQGYGQALAGGATPQQAQGAGAQAASMVPPGTGTGLPDTGTLGVDLGQMIVAPTVAYKVNPNHALGASLLLGFQRFEARGLGDFQCFVPSTLSDPINGQSCQQMGIPANPNGTGKKLTNNGHENSYGAGLRIGWTGKVHPMLTLGAAYSTKIYMSKFDDYKELFAGNGDFDIPAIATAGLALHPNPHWTIAFDYQRIFYDGVDSISNEGPVFNPTGGPVGIGAPAPPCSNCLLGQSSGMGFGWDDINVYKLGIVYQPNSQWAFRAGYHYNDNPVKSDQLLFNILAPAVVKHHATVGLTYKPTPNSEVNAAYMHAFKNKTKTSQTAFGIPGEISMYQNSLDVSYTWKF